MKPDGPLTLAVMLSSKHKGIVKQFNLRNALASKREFLYAIYLPILQNLMNISNVHKMLIDKSSMLHNPCFRFNLFEKKLPGNTYH